MQGPSFTDTPLNVPQPTTHKKQEYNSDTEPEAQGHYGALMAVRGALHHHMTLHHLPSQSAAVRNVLGGGVFADGGQCFVCLWTRLCWLIVCGL